MKLWFCFSVTLFNAAFHCLLFPRADAKSEARVCNSSSVSLFHFSSSYLWFRYNLCIVSRPFCTTPVRHTLSFRFRQPNPLMSCGYDRFLLTLLVSSDWPRQVLPLTPGSDVSSSPWWWFVFTVRGDGLGCVTVFTEDQSSSWLSFYQHWRERSQV